MTDFKRDTRKTLIRRARSVASASCRVTLPLLFATLVLVAPSAASGAYFHPSEQTVFGPDGTPWSETNSFGQATVQEIRFDNTSRRLYLMRPTLIVINNFEHPPQQPRGIFGFDLSNPDNPAPLGGAFPLPLSQPPFHSYFAIDESEGDVYYLESSACCFNQEVNHLYSWDAAGQLRPGFPKVIPQFGPMAVDPLGYLWVLQEGNAYKYSPDGALLQTVSLSGVYPQGITFNRLTGDMWINGLAPGEFEPEPVAVKFTAASGYTVHDQPFRTVGRNSGTGNLLAVDARQGVVYLNHRRDIVAYNESGDVLETFGLGGDQDSEASYKNGPFEANFTDLAVDEATEAVYTINVQERSSESPYPGSNVGVWPGISVPDVETGSPLAVDPTGATLTGHVAPRSGPLTDCEFEYITASQYINTRTVRLLHAHGGTFRLAARALTSGPIAYNATAEEVEQVLHEPDFSLGNKVHVSGPAGGPWTLEVGSPFSSMAARFTPSVNDLVPASAEIQVDWPAQKVPCVPAGGGSGPITSPTDVTADVSGLTTGVTYRYRLAATDANGRNLGNDVTFTANPSAVNTGAATEIEPESAKLNGTVDPEGLETTYYFEYGPNAEYGEVSATPPGSSVGSTEAGAKAVGDPIAGLTPGTTYHYRIVAVNSKGTSFGVDRTFATLPAVKGVTTEAATEIHRTDVTLHGSLDPDGLETTYYLEWGRTRRYGSTSSAPPGEDVGTTSPGEQQFSAPAASLKPETTYHFRIVAVNSRGTTYGEDLTFETLPAVKGLSTESATDIGTSEATLHGELDPDGYATTYYFQWGKTRAYGHSTPPAPGADVGTSAPGTLQLAGALDNLEPGTTYHFRLVAINSFGTTFGADRSFETPQPPSIEAFSSSHVTATGAELDARINPHGYPASYRFEYGTTTHYGSVAPIPDGTLGPTTSAEAVSASLSGLQGVTYHFRVVAESQWGTTTTEDQTFGFNPPNCPNAAVRQQTGAAYLPDCRAYELVSPGRAGGSLLLSGGPASPAATNNFAFLGEINIIPGSGNPPNGGAPSPAPDLYVARRTVSGWITHYVGLSADETIEQNGKPTKIGRSGPDRILANRELSRFLTWDQTFIPNTAIAIARSFAPYLWDSEGHPLGRLPSNFAQTPGADQPPAEGGFRGDIQPSADFSHYVFSSIHTAFAPGGLTAEPGSAYDNDLGTGSVQIVSKTASGADIPLDPFGEESAPQFIEIPAVSTDGSHILMSTAGAGHSSHLYMRVNDAVSYEVSRGQDGVNHGVDFAGMSADGSEVFFTTPIQMTADDHDSSIDLYRWAENEGAPTLTRISTGAEGSGDTDNCNSGWIAACGVEVVPTPGSGRSVTPAPSHDSAVAAESGDIYFYSPEQLEAGARGVLGERNLYVWHDGTVHFVAAFDPRLAIEHMNVSTDGSHMGLITKSRLTSYDNAGHAEMYVYSHATGKLVCASCPPDGAPPTSDVQGAQNGSFMSDDGRAFFSTEDALVPRDSNEATDVYEYVDGRPQLISSGAGTESATEAQQPGLVGVSADGNNAFFYTTQTLVPQDENGPFFKFYDARVNGGFPYVKPPAPCAAADECHGEGSSAPGAPQIGSTANLGAGGNATGAKKGRRQKHHRQKHHRQKHHRQKHHRQKHHRQKHHRATTRKGGPAR